MIEVAGDISLRRPGPTLGFRANDDDDDDDNKNNNNLMLCSVVYSRLGERGYQMLCLYSCSS